MATSTDGNGTAPEAASPAQAVRPATNETLHPAIALLSNGRYGGMVTAAGAVYGAPPHTGRGGWTWYTGSASWLYRVALEAILGFHREGNALRLDPCIPRGWPGFEIHYRHRSTTYRVRVDNSADTGRGVRSVVVDGQQLPGGAVPLCDDRQHHEVRVELG
jgi:cellobiose phosphorylase